MPVLPEYDLSGKTAILSTSGGGEAPFKFKVNSVYLFDAAMEKVYFGASVFDAETKASGFKEKLRYEMTAYQTDAAGKRNQKTFGPLRAG